MYSIYVAVSRPLQVEFKMTLPYMEGRKKASWMYDTKVHVPSSDDMTLQLEVAVVPPMQAIS